MGYQATRVCAQHLDVHRNLLRKKPDQEMKRECESVEKEKNWKRRRSGIGK